MVEDILRALLCRMFHLNMSLSASLVFSLLVLQNFTTVRKSGEILSAY